MNPDRMKELLLGALEQNPSLILDLYESPVRQPGGFHPPGDSNVPHWCFCQKCREMPTENEKIRFQRSPDHCLTLLPVSRVN